MCACGFVKWRPHADFVMHKALFRPRYEVVHAYIHRWVKTDSRSHLASSVWERHATAVAGCELRFTCECLTVQHVAWSPLEHSECEWQLRAPVSWWRVTPTLTLQKAWASRLFCRSGWHQQSEEEESAVLREEQSGPCLRLQWREFLRRIS